MPETMIRAVPYLVYFLVCLAISCSAIGISLMKLQKYLFCKNILWCKHFI